MAQALDRIVDWVTYFLDVRGNVETDDQWFSGKSWLVLMDFWVDLGRKVSQLRNLSTQTQVDGC